MIIDLMHNKIVAATMSEAFADSFKGRLLPLLSEKYGDSITVLQMYEDHISDGFTLGGEFYYPLTVVTDKPLTQWIKWKLAKGKFTGNSPYAFTGSELDFELVDSAPSGFEEKLIGRARFCESGLLPLRVETTLPDVTVLSGKYSQTFLDEMARQLTPAIEEAMSVEGLADSGLELCLVFAPESYMEHTSESVTYRRLLITDNSGAPRDFWIKWTRLDGVTAHTVASNVTAETVLFEIGEEVSQKVREKEYRFLLSAKGKDKYHNAMGRKNITEWREIIKRAVRRGVLRKVEAEVLLSEPEDKLTAELRRVVGAEMPQPVESEVVASRESDEELARALEFAKSALAASESSESENEERDEPIVILQDGDAEETADEDITDEEETLEESEETDELDEYYGEKAEAPTEISFDEADRQELDDLARSARAELESLIAAAETDEDELDEDELDEEESDDVEAEDECEADADREDAGAEDEADAQDPRERINALKEKLYAARELAGYGDREDPCAEEYPDYSEIEDEEALEDEEDAEALAEVAALDGEMPSEEDKESDPAEEQTLSEEIEETAAEEPVAAPIDYAAIEEKIRREVEAKLRLEYEMNARRKAEEEAERLRKENERLMRAAKSEEERKAREEKARLEETERLKAEIEARVRAEALERERMAEAAKAQLEEMRRIEEEKARRETLRREEEKRLAAEARERALIEEREREAERIRRETEERIRKEYESFNEQPAIAEEPSREATVNPNYTYTSKSVKLLFRRSVDPNITGHIHEIIKASLDYYGKSKVYLKIKATVPDNRTVVLEFVKIPMEEMELLGNIIKVLGNSGLGIAKAILD